MRTGEGCHINVNVPIKIFSIEYLVHKLLTIVTRFFVSFIKIPVLLKASVLKKLYPFRTKDYFNNQFKVSQSPYTLSVAASEYIFYLSLSKIFSIIKTRGVFRTQSTTLTYLRYPTKYFLKKLLRRCSSRF